jgi:cytochrome P450
MAFDFEPRSAAFIADPYPALAQARSAASLFHSKKLGGWVAAGFADCRALLKDPRLSADRMTPFFGHLPPQARDAVATLEAMMKRWAVFVDPPIHTRLRGLMNKAFSPRAIESLAPAIQARVDSLIDGFAGRPQIDFIREFAYPLPACVIADLLGVPIADVDLLKRWSDDLGAFVLTARASPDKYVRAEAAAKEMQSYFDALVAARRMKPGTDAASWLIEAADAIAAMDGPELTATCVLLLFAGHETTTHLLGNGLWALLTHPAELATLRAHVDDNAFVAGAVEEMLRWDGPSLAQVRIAREDIDWNGARLRQGERVFLMLAGAARDPNVCEAPDRFDVSRADMPHLAFGYGIHFCIGAPLARLEARIAFQRLLVRLPKLALVPGPLDWSDNLVVRGLHRLEIAIGTAARDRAHA